jgi:hypothetical protein
MLNDYHDTSQLINLQFFCRTLLSAVYRSAHRSRFEGKNPFPQLPWICSAIISVEYTHPCNWLISSLWFSIIARIILLTHCNVSKDTLHSLGRHIAMSAFRHCNVSTESSGWFMQIVLMILINDRYNFAISTVFHCDYWIKLIRVDLLRHIQVVYVPLGICQPGMANYCTCAWNVPIERLLLVEKSSKHYRGTVWYGQ